MSSSSAEAKETSKSAWARLVPLHPDSQHISITRNPFVLGRNPKDCHYKIDNIKISAVHCRISKVDDCVLLEDLSTNGTFLKGQRIGRGNKHVVTHGDVISLLNKSGSGPLSFMFQSLSWEDKCEKESKDEIFKYYQLGKTLGTGNFSAVKLCIEKKTGTSYAAKIIDKQKFWHVVKTRDQILSEVEILHQIQHPNIISVVRVFDEARYFYIVLELANGGELFDQIRERGSFVEPDAKTVFEQILKGVKYLHDLNISHRDLKPENILIDVPKDGVPIIKITDFGLARIIGENQTAATLCGTPMYVAPEVLAHGMYIQGDESSGTAHGYGKEVDAWSLGCILYVLLSGHPPFDDRTNLFEQIRCGMFSFDGEVWQGISSDAQDLIKKLLVVSPEQRLTIQEALAHPWISGRPSDPQRSSERPRPALKSAGTPPRQSKKIAFSPSSSANSRSKSKAASENDDLNTTEVVNTPARQAKVGLMEPGSSPYKPHETNKRKSVDPSLHDDSKEESPLNRPNKRRNTTNVVASTATPTPSKRGRSAPKSVARGKSEPEILVASTPGAAQQAGAVDALDCAEEKVESTQTRRLRKRAGKR